MICCQTWTIYDRQRALFHPPLVDAKSATPRPPPPPPSFRERASKGTKKWYKYIERNYRSTVHGHGSAAQENDARFCLLPPFSPLFGSGMLVEIYHAYQKILNRKLPVRKNLDSFFFSSIHFLFEKKKRGKNYCHLFPTTNGIFGILYRGSCWMYNTISKTCSRLESSDSWIVCSNIVVVFLSYVYLLCRQFLIELELLERVWQLSQFLCTWIMEDAGRRSSSGSKSGRD